MIIRPAANALLVFALLCGCSEQRGDKYDVTKMDLHPAPAKITGERHTGPYSGGAALSADGPASVRPTARH